MSGTLIAGLSDLQSSINFVKGTTKLQGIQDIQECFANRIHISA
jgi:hypothetical protein